VLKGQPGQRVAEVGGNNCAQDVKADSDMSKFEPFFSLYYHNAIKCEQSRGNWLKIMKAEG
jgi:hypothetical protein